MRTISKKELKTILEKHCLWYQSNGNQGERADLTRADLTGADLDISVWPLWCGSLNLCSDEKLRIQLAFHWASLVLNSKSASKEEMKYVRAMLKYLNKFHRNDVARLAMSPMRCKIIAS